MFSEIVKISLPVAFGYVPLGMTFGILLNNLGIEWYWSTVMAIFIYAGAAQFMALTLLSQNVSIVEVFSSTLLINLRHFFYGIAMRERFSNLKRFRIYAIFGLTDETFSLLSSSTTKAKDNSFLVKITFINHFWWVLGCTLGAIFKTKFPFNSKGMEFSLTCLFVVLLVENWLKQKDLKPIVLGLVSGSVTLILFSGKNFLLYSMIGVFLSTFIFRDEARNG